METNETALHDRFGYAARSGLREHAGRATDGVQRATARPRRAERPPRNDEETGAADAMR